MRFRWPRFSMRMLLIAMLLLGTGLGFLGRRLIKIRTEADRQLEMIRRLEERGVDFSASYGPLEIYDSLIYAIDLRTQFTRVSSVTLAKGELTSKEIEEVTSLPRLTSFYDFYGHCTDADLARLAKCRTLHFMWLSNWKGTAEGAKAFFRSKASPVDCIFGAVLVDDEFLALASQSHRLETLSIEGAGITSAGIAELKRSTSLTGLNIHGGTNLGKGLASLGDCAVLSAFSLSDYHFANGEIDEFSKLDSTWHLRLDCDSFPLGTLQAIGDCKRLNSVRLTGQFSTEEVISSLACKNLQSIQIDNVLHTPGSLISELAKLPRLKCIWLPKSAVRSHDLELLIGLASLEELAISATAASVESINRFQKKLPNCSVSVVYTDGRVFRYPPGGGAPELFIPAR